uniref:Uncharacterized protein n=1 Tax=Steinernema glaseri TaxID=37863 RepID=A0A1I7ZE84_9BILA
MQRGRRAKYADFEGKRNGRRPEHLPVGLLHLPKAMEPHGNILLGKDPSDVPGELLLRPPFLYPCARDLWLCGVETIMHKEEHESGLCEDDKY